MNITDDVTKSYIDFWNNLNSFKNVEEIPYLPATGKIFTQDDINNFFIPKLIECGAIPKEKLVVGKTYIGSCRNADEATWDGEKFNYKRYKWGMTLDDTIQHFQDETNYDVFIPIKEK